MILGNRSGCRVQHWQAGRLPYNAQTNETCPFIDESRLDRDARLA